MPRPCALEPHTDTYEFIDETTTCIQRERRRILGVIGWRLMDVMNRSMVDADDATLIQNLIPDVSGTVLRRLMLR